MAYRNFFIHIVTEKQTDNRNIDDEDDSDDESNLNIFHETTPVRRKVKCDITLPIIASTFNYSAVRYVSYFVTVNINVANSDNLKNPDRYVVVNTYT